MSLQKPSMEVFFKMFNWCFRLGMLPAWHDLPHMPLILYVNCLVRAEGSGRDHPVRAVSDHLFGTVRTPSGPWTVREESWNTSVTWPFCLFSLDYVICSWHSTREQKQFCFCSDWLSVKSESCDEYSILSAFRPTIVPACLQWEWGWGAWGSLDFLFEGGSYFDCLYLSGVNFQALSSFWSCSSLSLVCSSSAFILRKNKLMAGSTMDDRSWATLGCWTCLRYWIWVWRMWQIHLSHRVKPQNFSHFIWQQQSTPEHTLKT